MFKHPTTMLLFLFCFTLLLPCFPSSSIPLTSTTTSGPTNRGRETLDIGIGIGIGGGGTTPPVGGGGGSSTPCPPPPPTPCPPPPRKPPTPFPPPPRKPPTPPLQFENQKLKQAYNVIQNFKKTITCDPKRKTLSWSSRNYNVCSYTGFLCDYAPGDKKHRTVAAVDFNQFGICAPTISGFADKLPDLALFHANSNNFFGTVPDLSHLQYLYELDLSNNKLSGQFPNTVLPLANITFLDLRFNNFVGNVAPSVFSITLDVLFLNNNKFNQPIPANIGSTTAIYLTLANNGFTGPIPRTICNTSNTLKEVLFLNNRLSGCLPYEIGLLNKATVFDAGFNQITGPIPLSFGCLRKIEQLNFAGNLLYGEIPDEVCRLGNLKNLSLSNNYFTSLGKSCSALLKNGVLDIRNNCIPGCQGQRRAMECQQFLRKPKTCPMLTYVPCKPYSAHATTTLSEADRKPSRYMTYSMLVNRPEP